MRHGHDGVRKRLHVDRGLAPHPGEQGGDAEPAQSGQHVLVPEGRQEDAQVGQNLEKSGKSSAALGYYKRIVKDFANTPAAKTAKQRIKAIENP